MKCHICGKDRNETGELYCSAAHKSRNPRKFGLIGLNHGQKFISLINRMPENAQVIGLCARNNSSYNNLKEKPNNFHTFYNNAFDLINSDVDAVICTAGPTIQKDLAVYALDCNKHVILEKPLALNLKDALEIQKAAERTKKNVIVNYTDLWHPKYIEIFSKKTVSPTFIKCDYGGFGPFRKDYSPLLDWGSHPLALLLDYQDLELPIFYNILDIGFKDKFTRNYAIQLGWENVVAWINVGNFFIDQKVRRFSTYDVENGVLTYEQFKTQNREQKLTDNPMLNMLTEYIEKLEKNEYWSNMDLAVKTTELLEELESKL